MTPQRWSRIEGLFLQAVELDPESRATFLEEECAGDADLREQVDRLLAADTGALTALAGAVAETVREIDDASQEPRVQRIGPYEILNEIGRGGMGIVYRARRDDDVFRKDVAIKVVKRGMDTEQVLTRFLHERRILARLEHPSIARIIDGGSTESGLPYLVMEYVEGLVLTDYCAENHLSLRQRLELFCKVCTAVEYAHQHLVVHRDLKPSNILVDSEGTPKLLDFGIAKLLSPGEAEPQSLALTSEDTRVLTPQYASPEQVLGEPITTSSDIYALGTVLYELLTGSQAHQITSHTTAALARAICEKEVVLPSKSARSAQAPPVPLQELVGDLDNILMTALRKDRRERYSSVHHLAEDLRRFMADLPVSARPQTLRYRTVKFLRRNRMPVIAASLAAASLIGGTAISIYQARRADRRFQEVRTLANSVLFDIHDQIETLPGATPAREVMVRTVLRYLNNLARESHGDPGLQWELATAYQKVGDVQGYGLRPNLGQGPAALESHSKALEIAQSLAARDSDPKIRRLLALAHHRVGFLSLGQRPKPDEGLQHYRDSLQILEGLNREFPGDPQNSPLLMMVLGHMGDAEMVYADPAKAPEYWQRTLEVAQQWSDRNPSDAATNALGLAHRRLSRVAQLNGDLPKALEHARKAIALHEPLAQSQPSNVARQRELLNSYERLAYVAADPDYLSLEDRVMAFTYNQKVTAIAEALLDADPKNIMAASDLLLARRSNCLFIPGDNVERLLQTCEKFLNAAAKTDRNRSEVPFATERLAPILVHLRRQAEAVEMIERSIQMLNSTIAQYPTRSDLRLQQLRLHTQLGTILAPAHQKEALEHYQSALAIGEPMLAQFPHDLVLRRDLADCYASLGRYFEARDPAQAVAWYRKDLAVWTEWPSRAVSSAWDQSRREAALRNISRCEGRSARKG